MNRRAFGLALSVLSSIAASTARAGGPEDSVVHVHASIRYPNPIRPWARQNPAQIAATGVVIDGGRILTNAHLVLYAGEVFVQDRQGGDRIEARVESIGPGIDLATLVVEDDAFLEKHPGIPGPPGARPSTPR
jgi:S1-C subfamily serine protease